MAHGDLCQCFKFRFITELARACSRHERYLNESYRAQGVCGLLKETHVQSIVAGPSGSCHCPALLPLFQGCSCSPPASLPLT